MEFRFELPDGYSYQDVLALMRVLIRKRKIGRWVRLLSERCRRSICIQRPCGGVAQLAYAGKGQRPYMYLPG